MRETLQKSKNYSSPLWYVNMLILDRVLIGSIESMCAFPSEEERDRIISGLRYFGLFTSERARIIGGNPLDTLCGRLEELLSYQPGERDLVMLQHTFVIEWENGQMVSYSTSLPVPLLYGMSESCVLYSDIKASN